MNILKELESLEDVAKEIKNSGKKVTLLYAFNATGKTRLSMEFKELVNEVNDEGEVTKHVIYYNSFTEDLFYWDNDLDNNVDRKLKINTSSTFITLIEKLGKEAEIAKKFNELISPEGDSKIEPRIDTKTGEVNFNLATGDDKAKENIKISKGEECVFIWSVFYVLIETIILELNVDDLVERSTDEFDDYNYIFIDDPISSLDDNHAIDIALDLKSLISISRNEDLKFVISSHHALFYNVLHTEFDNANRYVLTNTDNKYVLNKLTNRDSPFGYHLLVKDEIQRAILTNDIKRYHFNLMRNLLEKTAHFLGYDQWKDLIQEEDRKSYIKRINLYSHSDHDALEAKELQEHEKRFLKRIFEKFISEYKWREVEHDGS